MYLLITRNVWVITTSHAASYAVRSILNFKFSIIGLSLHERNSVERHSFERTYLSDIQIQRNPFGRTTLERNAVERVRLVRTLIKQESYDSLI